MTDRRELPHKARRLRMLADEVERGDLLRFIRAELRAHGYPETAITDLRDPHDAAARIRAFAGGLL